MPEPAKPGPPQPVDAAPGSWEAWVNRTSAILAVLAALSSGQWGASNLRAILEQGKVNDGWAFYQAKSIKGHSAENSAALATALAADLPPEKSRALAALAVSMTAETKRYETEKKKQFSENQQVERSRDVCVDRSFWFEIAFVSLQVGVVLSTIAAAAKKKGLWISAIGAGLLGIVLVVNGRYLFISAPSDLSRLLGLKLEPKIATTEGSEPRPATASAETPPK
jgi:hypothetical protein